MSGIVCRARLRDVDQRLERFCELVHERLQADTGRSLVIVCGHRDEQAQETAYKKGASKAKYGQSAHNTLPSVAVDIAPSGPTGGIDWDVRGSAWQALLRIASEAAIVGDVPIDWRRSMFPGDEGHVELRGWRDKR